MLDIVLQFWRLGCNRIKHPEAQEERCQWQGSQRQKTIFMLESQRMNSTKSCTSSRSFQGSSEWWYIVFLNPGKKIAPMYFHPSFLLHLRDQLLGQCRLKMSIRTEAGPIMGSWELGLQSSSVVPLQLPLFSSQRGSHFYFLASDQKLANYQNSIESGWFTDNIPWENKKLHFEKIRQ